MLSASSVGALRERVVRALLALLDGAPLQREPIAEYAIAHIRSSLKSSSSHWRYGFRESPDEIAMEAANLAACDLLREMEPLESCPAARPKIVKSLQASVEAAGNDSLEERLLVALHRILRRKGRQGLCRLWKERHPEEARLLRQMKMCIRVLPAVRLVRDARGAFVCGPRADLRKPPIRREELNMHLFPAAFLLRLDGFGEAISGLFAARSGHGGYCYLMDLVRLVHERRVDRMREGQDATRPAGIEAFLAITSRMADDWHAWLLRRAQVLALDQETRRMRRRERESSAPLDQHGERTPPGEMPRDVRRALGVRIHVAAEMAGRKFGLGRADWAAISQRKLLERLMPAKTSAVELDALRKQTDYLVLCLTRELRAAFQSGRAARETT